VAGETSAAKRLALDASVAPERVLLGQSPHEELGLERDPPSRLDSMRSTPFSTDQLPMPSPQRVRRDQGREPFACRSQSLEQGQDDPLIWSDPRTIHLATEDTEFLAEHQQLDVLGPRRPTGEQNQPEELTADEGDETHEHVESLSDPLSQILAQRQFDGFAWSAGRRRHDTLHPSRSSRRRLDN